MLIVLFFDLVFVFGDWWSEKFFVEYTKNNHHTCLGHELLLLDIVRVGVVEVLEEPFLEIFDGSFR